MTIHVTLNNVGSLIDATTAAATINSNNAVITAALGKALSTEGTDLPNQMNNSLDMNSNQIVNLPAPLTTTSPLRLADLTSFTGGGTITNIPTGGATNALLKKNSATNYDIGWTSTPVLGAATATTINKVTITQPANGSTLTIPEAVTLTGPATSGTAATLGNTETFTGVKTFGTSGSVGRLKIAGATSGVTILDATAIAGSGTVTLPASTDTLVGKATTDTLTNKTYDTAGAGNVLKINTSQVTAVTGTGSTVVLATSPTITTPLLVATVTNDSANAGNIGEIAESSIASGSATGLSTGVSKTVTSLSLTAGDWEICGYVNILPAATTNLTAWAGSLGSSTNTLDFTNGRFNQQSFSAGTVPGANPISIPLIPFRISIASTTSVFLVAFAAFTVSTAAAYGILRARRIR